MCYCLKNEMKSLKIDILLQGKVSKRNKLSVFNNRGITFFRNTIGFNKFVQYSIKIRHNLWGFNEFYIFSYGS